MGQHLLYFRVASRICALPVSEVEETMRPLPIEPLPEMPPFVLGASIIRGAPTPVVDLGAFLSGEKLDGPRRAITVKAGDGRRVALLVSDVMTIGTSDSVSSEAMPPLLRDAAPDAIRTLARLDEGLLTVFQLGRLVPERVFALLEKRGEPAAN
jgi:purine-binding chemotaxis protein CheW